MLWSRKHKFKRNYVIKEIDMFLKVSFKTNKTDYFFSFIK